MKTKTKMILYERTSSRIHLISTTQHLTVLSSFSNISFSPNRAIFIRITSENNYGQIFTCFLYPPIYLKILKATTESY